jgi:alcohol dehydrogenase class IV
MSNGVLGSLGESITDYDGFDKSLTQADMKTFAIPSTSGTGSEVSDGVGVIDEHRSSK